MIFYHTSDLLTKPCLKNEKKMHVLTMEMNVTQEKFVNHTSTLPLHSVCHRSTNLIQGEKHP